MWVIDEMKQSVRHPGGERGRRGGKRRAPRRRGMWSSVYTKYIGCAANLSLQTKKLFAFRLIKFLPPGCCKTPASPARSTSTVLILLVSWTSIGALDSLNSKFQTSNTSYGTLELTTWARVIVMERPSWIGYLFIHFWTLFSWEKTNWSECGVLK